MTNTPETATLGQLQKKSREELLALLAQLIQQQPTIEPLIAMLLKLPQARSDFEVQTPGAGRECTLDSATISSQIAAAFSHAGSGWGAASRAALELYRLSEIGDRFTETGQWANAQVVYAAIAEEILPSYEELEDEDQLAGVLENCSTGLVTCLEVQEDLPPEDQLDEAQRKALLTSLLPFWTFDSSYGRQESAIPEALAHHVTESERVESPCFLAGLKSVLRASF
jgi:hypothetical protein